MSPPISKFPKKEEITMYGNSACYNMPPPWMWGGQNTPPPAMPDLNTVRSWMKDLKEWEKDLKGKDEGPKKKSPDVSVFSMMLLMLLLSPITGPSMYYFFQMSLGILHK